MHFRGALLPPTFPLQTSSQQPNGGPQSCEDGYGDSGRQKRQGHLGFLGDIWATSGPQPGQRVVPPHHTASLGLPDPLSQWEPPFPDPAGGLAIRWWESLDVLLWAWSHLCAQSASGRGLRWPKSQEGQTRHLRGSRASSDLGTQHTARSLPAWDGRASGA